MRGVVQVRVVDLDDLPRTSRYSVDELLDMWQRSLEGSTSVLGMVLGRQMVWAHTGSPDALRSSRQCGMPDEHFAVDIDSGEKLIWRDCADVLYGIRPLTLDAAVENLRSLTADHPGCRLAAVPVDSGGWVVACGPDRFRVMVKRPAGRPEPDRTNWSLLPSCLHGWLATGHSLRELPSARATTHGVCPAPVILRMSGDRPDMSARASRQVGCAPCGARMPVRRTHRRR